MANSHHVCDLCEADNPLVLPQDPRISVCGSCGFVYVAKRRSPEEIAAAWSEVYANGGYDPNWPAVKARLYYVAEWVDQTIGLDGETVLDVGAGDGWFVDLARDFGADAFGMEPTELGPGIWRGSVERPPRELLSLRFDIVTVLWTLENCGDCIGMLKFARDRLAPGGHVVVATGSRILVPFKKPLSSYLNPVMPADLHCFRWSFASLFNAGRKAGMKMTDFNPFYEQDWLVMSFVAGKSKLTEIKIAEFAPAQPRDVVVSCDDDPAAVLRHFADWERRFL